MNLKATFITVHQDQIYDLHCFCLIETCGVLKGYSVRAPRLHCELSGELEAELPYLPLYFFLKREGACAMHL